MGDEKVVIHFANYQDAIDHAKMDLKGKHPEYKIEETFYGSIPTQRSWYVENKKDPAIAVWAIHEVPLF